MNVEWLTKCVVEMQNTALESKNLKGRMDGQFQQTQTQKKKDNTLKKEEKDILSENMNEKNEKKKSELKSTKKTTETTETITTTIIDTTTDTIAAQETMTEENINNVLNIPLITSICKEKLIKKRVGKIYGINMQLYLRYVFGSFFGQLPELSLTDKDKDKQREESIIIENNNNYGNSNNQHCQNTENTNQNKNKNKNQRKMDESTHIYGDSQTQQVMYLRNCVCVCVCVCACVVCVFEKKINERNERK